MRGHLLGLLAKSSFDYTRFLTFLVEHLSLTEFYILGLAERTGGRRWVVEALLRECKIPQHDLFTRIILQGEEAETRETVGEYGQTEQELFFEALSPERLSLQKLLGFLECHNPRLEEQLKEKKTTWQKVLTHALTREPNKALHRVCVKLAEQALKRNDEMDNEALFWAVTRSIRFKARETITEVAKACGIGTETLHEELRFLARQSKSAFNAALNGWSEKKQQRLFAALLTNFDVSNVDVAQAIGFYKTQPQKTN